MSPGVHSSNLLIRFALRRLVQSRKVVCLSVSLVLACSLAIARGQSSTFGGDAQHTGQYSAPAQPLNRVHWSTAINLTNFQANAHYGAPLLTPANTVVVPVRTASGFQVSAFDGATGRLKYTLATDYRLPAHNWLPAYQPALAAPPSGMRLYYAGAGGTVYYIENPDSDAPRAPMRQCFYTDLGSYQSNAAAFNQTVFINTALTADTNGVVFFGFRLETNAAPYPFNTTNSGFGRLAPDGTGLYVLATQAAGDPKIVRVPHNCGPALSRDGRTVYVVGHDVASSSAYSYLLGLDSTTLATKYTVFLQTNYSVYVDDDSTASPVVGPDGDIFFGVLSGGDRGLLLHYSGDLSTEWPPGSFGWDNTPAIVPTNMVPGYTGSSAYLLFSKYNNYAGSGDGINKIALLDPKATQVDSYYRLTTMREVLTATGPTPDPSYQGAEYPYAVREWCISAGAVNPATRSVYMPNEDGHLYRWDLAANSLSAALALEPNVSEAYVPTVLGPDGTVYTLSNDSMFACGGLSNLAVGIYSSAPDLRPGVVGQPVTFTASVTNLNPLGPAPTGTVTFNDLTYRGVIATNTTLAANVPLSNGPVSVTTTSLVAASNFLGNHFITAIYSGDANFPTGSVTLVQKVHASASTTTLKSSVQATSSVVVVLSATVTPQPVTTNLPGGMVSFWDGPSLAAQAPLNNGVARVLWRFSPATHALSATYNSDTVFAGSGGSLLATPPVVTAAMDPGSGVMLLTFTNFSGVPFEALRAPDCLWPLATWSSLGPVTEVLPGQYQFLDAIPASAPKLFYRIQSP
jgi:hypothetical protein